MALNTGTARRNVLGGAGAASGIGRINKARSLRQSVRTVKRRVKRRAKSAVPGTAHRSMHR